MSIFRRISDIFKANVTDMVDRMENPEKMVKQMIVEMEEGLIKATSALAMAMANERNLQRQQANALEQARQWEQKAGLALQAGNPDLAKEALSKKLTFDGQAKQVEAMIAQAAGTTAQLRNQLEDLKAKLEEARLKQTALVARAQAATTQKMFSTALGSNTGQGAFAKFEKMERKIEGMEAEAQAFAELSGSSTTEDAFKAMENSMRLEAEMARLMARMNQGEQADA